MLLTGGFQKFAGIPPGISRIFESLMVQQISANRRENHSIQVEYIGHCFFYTALVDEKPIPIMPGTTYWGIKT